MKAKARPQFNSKTDLIIERIVNLSPEKIWAAWTMPALMTEWFCPKPWKTVGVELELRPGGIFRFVMRSPEGAEYPCSGCILEVVENELLVWTDALTPGYRPGSEPFMTAAIALEPHPRGTRYIAHAMHKDEATRKKHEEMGFSQGWNICLDQLIELMNGGGSKLDSAGVPA